MTLGSQRDAETVYGTVYLGLALVFAWMIGASGLSFAWLVLLMALVETIIKTRLSRLLQASIQHHLSRLRRRRALYKDETAEWLSLLLNKWLIRSSYFYKQYEIRSPWKHWIGQFLAFLLLFWIDIQTKTTIQKMKKNRFGLSSR